MDEVTGVVLAGGSSRRMGTDKALLVLDSKTLLERVVAALVEAGIRDVVVVGGSADWPRGVARWLPDNYPGEGPLGGVITAGTSLSTPWMFLCSCDLVSVDSAAVRMLLDYPERMNADCVIPVDREGRRATMHALYRNAVIQKSVSEFAAGERRMSVLTTPPARVVEIHVTGRPNPVGPEFPEQVGTLSTVLETSIRDADSPQDWEHLIRRVD